MGTFKKFIDGCVTDCKCSGKLTAKTDAEVLTGKLAEKLDEEITQPMKEEFMPLLTSPNGTQYKITVDDSGNLSATAVED